MTRVTTGLEHFLRDPVVVRGRRVGLLTNPTGIDRQLRTTVNLAAAHPDIDLVALFGPEHGVRGSAQAGEHVSNAVDGQTGITMHSLYGTARRPSTAMLEPIDAMVIDFQDIGVRYATYLSTVSLVIDACAESGVEVVILDRPNPLGGSAVSGNVLEAEFSSFVGTHTVPILHGLTIGEFGRLWARDRGLPSPRVVPMTGWEREMWFDQTGLPWVLPSPNLPTLDSVAVYPATCLLEGTNVSEGRGTTRPFEMIGAPWIDGARLRKELDALHLPGVGFRDTAFTPSFSKHHGTPCEGVQIHLTHRRAIEAVRLGVVLLAVLRSHSPDQFDWTPRLGDHHFIDLLAGSSALRNTIDRGADVDDMLKDWEAGAANFAAARQDILLY